MIRRLVTISFLALWSTLLFAGPPRGNLPSESLNQPVICIIIDDLGIDRERGEQALELPGAVTYAFLPHSRYGHDLALRAHELGRESLLHLPMQAIDNRRVDEGALTRQQSRAQFLATLREDLQRIPYISGVNNHMGSLLTQLPEQMQWLMDELVRHKDLFFIDSRTTPHTVAYRQAIREGLPSLRRSVFLDNEANINAINGQFTRLLNIARQHGFAVAIGHPYPETLTYLEAILPTLPLLGIRLMPASQLIERKTLLAQRATRLMPLQTAGVQNIDPASESFTPAVKRVP
jgi:polysaccharide deacetylase 2 family uncharacterized protein YibQ